MTYREYIGLGLFSLRSKGIKRILNGIFVRYGALLYFLDGVKAAAFYQATAFEYVSLWCLAGNSFIGENIGKPKIVGA